MTLGNSPQPLTRRQLRELAREQVPASDEAESPVSDAAPADTPGVDDLPHHSRHTSPAAEPSDATPRQPDAEATDSATDVDTDVDVSDDEAHVADAHDADPRNTNAAAPRGTAPAPLPQPETHANAEGGRTLTRRELRALQAAASTSAGDAEDSNGDAQAAPAPVTAAPAPLGAEAGFDTPSAALNPPVGHWSVDREDDGHIEAIGRRDDDTFDDLVGRGIGAGGIPTTTNALILPAIPRQGTGGPITSTGEIMITGSIDLPRSLGATGQLPNLFDSSEMDRMLDQLDEGGHHNDVAPVSASRAVSTHTSTRGVMTPPRKRGASLPTVLAITAAVLAIGVLSLFVIGYAFNIY
jgi:hypothetical protein